MKSLINRIYNKSSKDEFELNMENETQFNLKIDNILIGILYTKDKYWFFEYSEEFKNNKDKYYRMVGFSDLDKIYKSDVLWPFFKIRIPGLKQPLIIEILKKENINSDDEVELLKRFGKEVISNPYKLELIK